MPDALADALAAARTHLDLAQRAASPDGERFQLAHAEAAALVSIAETVQRIERALSPLTFIAEGLEALTHRMVVVSHVPQ